MRERYRVPQNLKTQIRGAPPKKACLIIYMQVANHTIQKIALSYRLIIHGYQRENR